MAEGEEWHAFCPCDSIIKVKIENMSKNKKQDNNTSIQEEMVAEQMPEQVEQTPANEIEEQPAPSELEQLNERIAELEDKNLRMMAEFDNYRRRTNKEKLELMATAGERIFEEMLPLVDDFERAVAAMEKTEDIDALREGICLIQQKFISFLEKQNVHAIETENADFNTDEHEAITMFAAGEDKKGKVIDCTQRGYKLGEKVIRFAKVVVGE